MFYVHDLKGGKKGFGGLAMGKWMDGRQVGGSKFVYPD